MTPQSIVWEKDGVAIPNASSNTLSVSQIGSYRVTATFSDGCVGQDTRVVTASEYPAQVITKINGLTQGFSGDPVVLEVVGGGDATDFHWKVKNSVDNPNPFTDATGTGSFRRVIFRPGAASDVPYELEVTPRRNTCPGVPFKRFFTSLSQAKKILDTVKMYHPDLSGTPLGYLYLPNHTPERTNGCFGQLGPVTLNATLDLGKYYNLGKNAFSADIKLKIVAHVDAPGQNQEWIFPLHIDQTAPEQMFSKRIDINPALIRFFTIEREGNSYVCNSVAAASAIRLIISSTEEDVVDVQNVNVYPDAVTQDQANKRWEQTFTWTTTCQDVTDYLFLIVKQYGDIAPNNLNSPTLWKNALRIRTESSDRSVTISMGEGSGKYYWRVMPLGSQEGGLTIPTNLGDTSDVMSFTYTHPEEDKNWIYSRTFTEGNKVSEQVGYANGLLQSGQQITKIQGENRIIAAQTIQDYAGRNAVSSLPIPVTDVRSLQYVDNLLTDSIGHLYRAPDFDGRQNPKMATARGGYYSGAPVRDAQNVLQNDRVPSAEGYPFTQTDFLNDGSGRISKQAGVGFAHSKKGGHTVRTFYTQASEAELVALFGNEAPQDSSVEKITTYDANNVASIAFQTKDGKIIASGLAMTGTGGPLEELSTAPSPLPSYFQRVKNNLRINDATVVSRTPLFLTMPGDVTVNYEITPAQLQEICSGNGNADLVASYPFEGNAQDISGHNNHGIAGQDAAIDKDMLGRNSAYALTGGTNSYVQAPHTPDMRFDARDFTVSFWVKRTSNTSSSWTNAPGVSKWNNLNTGASTNGTNEWALLLRQNGNSAPAFMIESGTTRHTVSASTTLAIGNWYHLVGVRQGNLLKIYVNGQLAGSYSMGSASVPVNNNQLPLQIGRIGAFGAAAVFDDVQIYRRALSAEEINQLRDRSTLCTTCDYTVSFKLLKNGAVVSGAPLPAPFTINAGSCSTQTNRKYIMPPAILTLEGGVNYTLEKYLTLNNKTRDSATVTFVDSATAKVEAFYRAKANSRLAEINDYINRHEYDLLEQYLKTNATDDAANKQYILTLLPAGAGGCQQIIYIPKWAKCPVDVNVGYNCGSNGASFEGYFEEYYKDRTDLLTVTPEKTTLNYAYFTNQFPSAEEREQHYARGEFDAMIRNLITDNSQLGTSQAACDRVWQVWKKEVMQYESGITYTPEPQENTIGLEPAIPAKYSLLQSFLTSMDADLQRGATEQDADLCVGTGRPLFIKRTTLYGKMGTTVISPDLAHAYSLVYYNSDVNGMKDMLRFYANIQDPDPEHPRDPVLQDFNDLLPCDKYKVSQSTSMGDLGFVQQDSQDAEALAEQQINALRNKCGEACENREAEFRQAVIGKLMATPGTKIQHYNVYWDNTYRQPGAWIGILDSTRNATSYTFSQCDLEGLTTALVRNCKSQYCDVTLTPRDTVITSGTRNITYRTYGTKDQLRQIEKVLMYDFELQLSDTSPACENGWDFIPKVSGANISPRIEWGADYIPVDVNNMTEMKVDRNGNIIYIEIDSITTDTEKIGGFHIMKRSPNGTLLMDKTIREIDKNPYINLHHRSTCSFAVDKNGGIVMAAMLSYGINDFDPGIGVTSLGSLDGYTLVIARYDANGKLLTAKSTPFAYEYEYGGLSDPEVDVDPNGNIFITSLYRSIDLDFSALENVIQRFNDAPHTVVAKYTPNLTYLWHVTLSSPRGAFHPSPRLKIDNDGAPIIVFTYRQSLEMRDLNGSLMTVPVNATDQTAIIKLTEDGALNWVKTFNFSTGMRGLLSVGESNNLYLAVAGVDNCFVIKVDSQGNFIWRGDFDQNVADVYPVVYDAKTKRLVLSGYIRQGTEIAVDLDFSEKEFMLARSESHTYFAAVYSPDRQFINADVVGSVHYTDLGGSIGYMTETASYRGSAYLRASLRQSRAVGFVKYNIIGAACPVSKNICFKFTGPRLQVIKVPDSLKNYVYDPVFPDCETEIASRLHTAIDQQVDQLIATRVSSYREQYYGTCGNPSRLDDKLTILKTDGQYHYTLYYYDRAGNLVRTVPPEGIAKPLPVGNFTDIEASRKVLPDHKMVTEYQYNTLGQLIRQHTPDGNYLLAYNMAGTTATEVDGFAKPTGTDEATLNSSKYYNTIIYNDKGQVRFSCDAQQKLDKKYSYTKYDELGRVIEVGEGLFYNEATVMSKRNEIGASSYPVDKIQFVTRTIYSQPFETSSVDGWPSIYVQNESTLLNRVSYTYLDKDGNGGTLEDRSYTIYDYDVHGNARWLVQKLPGLSAVGMRYEYDLLTDITKEVAYSPENKDASFYQRYEYDSNKRLRTVKTSRDRKLWENEVTYNYFLHGPLKRATIGEDLLQGIDYTYTIQGWLKGINHGLLDSNIDPGKDAAGASVVGRDAFGMGLGYHAGDYNFENSPFMDQQPGNMAPKNEIGLFNGNIATWTSNILYPANSITDLPQLTGNQYTYDKLNRLLTSRLGVFNAQENAFPIVDRYKSKHTYDGNGNIKKAVTGSNTATDLDRITYNYQEQTINNYKVKINNRLNSASDSTGLINNFPDDIDPGQVAYNYQYDAIGNLTHDVQQQVTIDWNSLGKVESVTRRQDDKDYVTAFTYDVAGNRVIKRRTNPSGVAVTDFYVRDIAGNIMAVYERTEQAGQPTETLITELPIYGNDRIGMYSRSLTAHVIDEQTNTEDGELRISQDGIKARYEYKSYLLNAGVELTIVSGFEYKSEGEGATFRIRAGVDSNEQDPQPLDDIYTRSLNSRRYELKDHLGNARVAITDIKLSTFSSNLPTGYRPEVVGTYNYYPFGMTMPGRTWESGLKYRYGFNGKEKDTNGEWGSTSYDYGLRIYNPGIGRFLSVDPLTSSFAYYSPYQFAGNKPIMFIDLDGAEFQIPEFEKFKYGYHPVMDGVNVVNNTAINTVNGGISLVNSAIYVGHRTVTNPSTLPKELKSETSAMFSAMGEYLVATYNYYTKTPASQQVLDTYEGLKDPASYEAPLEFATSLFLTHNVKVSVLTDDAAASRAAQNTLKAKKPCGCFDARTLILIDSGLITIDKIKVGSLVWARNEKTGDNELKKVARTFSYERDTLYHIQVNGTAVDVTADHPFFSNGKWVATKDLKIGDPLDLYSNKNAILKSVSFTIGRFTVYNFIVEDDHTYYVSTQNILVHNGGPCDLAKRLKAGELRLTAASKAEAGEVLQQLFVGGKPGIANSDGFDSFSAKRFFNRDQNYYHWDDEWVYNKDLGKYHLKFHDPLTDKDAFSPHLQIHDKTSGKVIKIFYQGTPPPLLPSPTTK